MFTVESVDDTVARLRANGAELIGEVAQYEEKYRLCYMRGPAGIIVALAEELFRSVHRLRRSAARRASESRKSRPPQSTDHLEVAALRDKLSIQVTRIQLE